MKRRIVSAFAIAALMGLAGCGSSQEASEQTKHQATHKLTEHHDAEAKARTTLGSTEAGTYPEKYGEAFLAGCEHRGGASELCVCILRNSEGKISFTQFKREGITAARSKGDTSQAPALATIVRQCVVNQIAMIEAKNYDPAKEKAKAKAFAEEMFGGG